MPRISICIPTHNTARYLPQAIESVLSQDFADFELVICDNASTDETPEICRRYDDPRIRYVRFEELANQAGNFNRCIEEARGEFVTLLHADDYFVAGFLTDRARRLGDNPELGFVFGAVQVVDADGAILSINSRWKEDRSFRRGELFELLLSGCLISPPSLMVRRASIQTAGLFRTDLTWGHDWEWTLRLAQQNAAYFVSEPLSAYREHDASGTAEILNAATNGRQERLILRETLARVSVENGRRRLRRQAYRALSLRHMYFAEQSLLQAKRLVALNNLWYAACADSGMLTRPTFWALLCGSAGPRKLYSRYRSLRGTIAISGTSHD